MRSGAGGGLALAALAVLCATACSPSASELPAVPPPPEMLTEREFRAAAAAVVSERESTLRSGDLDAFLATVDDDELQFSATQRRWFNNLARMPVSELSLEVSDADLATADKDDESDLRLPVDFTMKLDGFEDSSVTQRLVYTFTNTTDGLLLAADRDSRTDRRAGWLPDPWDVTHVVVRQTDSILAFFDEDTSLYADSVMKDLQASRLTVMKALPEWSGKLVAYDISDLTSIQKGSPLSVAETGGIAYPVYQRPGSSEVAAHRFVVNPTVAHNALQREFLLRHELTHIAVGSRDDSSPLWLAEGAAGYVELSHLSVEQQRLISTYALSTLGAEPPSLASGSEFYADPEVNYGLAAAVCTYLVATRGRDVLWDLMDAFTEARGGASTAMTGQQADDLLVQEIGLDTVGLTSAALRWASGA